MKIAPDQRLEEHPPLRLAHVEPLYVLRGGMSLVYICRYIEAELVAVKTLRPEINSDVRAREMFARECLMWLLLEEHPNVIRALSAHRAIPEAPVVILEYQRRTLRDLLCREPMELSTARHLLAGIIDGLDHAATKMEAFVHADLKPENVMVTENGDAKVTDLGLARAVGIALSRQTQHGSPDAGSTSPYLIGTPLYMSPEVATGQAATPASDVYAVGCIAYEMLVGHPVFGTPTTAADYLLRHVHRAPRPVGEKREDVPSELAEMVDACLSKNPAARPRLADIRRALSHRHPPADADTAATSNKPASITRAVAAHGQALLGFSEESLKTCERLLRETPEGEVAISLLVTMTLIHLEREDVDKATEALERADAIGADAIEHPVHRARYLQCRARLALQKGRPHAALGYLNEITSGGAVHSSCWLDTSVVLEAMGRRDDAIKAMENAVGIAGNERYYTRLIGFLIQEQRWDEALRWANDAVEFHPGSGTARILRGSVLAARAMLAGDRSATTVDAVIADRQLAISRGTDLDENLRLIDELLPILLFRCASAFVEMGDNASAAPYWERAARSGNTELAPIAAFNLGICRETASDLKGAADAYRIAIDRGDPSTGVKAAFNLGSVLERSGDAAGAIAAYERTLVFRDDAWSARAMSNLGNLLASGGDVEAGIRYLRMAIGSGDATIAPIAACNLARLYEQLDRPADATSFYLVAQRSGIAEVREVATTGLARLARHR